ncbi:MAG: substrate-binding domain-containing protein [Bryobacteraceae bacterium]
MKFTIAVFAFALTGLSIGCNRGHKRTIAVIPKGNAHLFWQSVHAGAMKAARESKVDIVWNGPPTETDYGGQLQIADAMINRHVDAIALAPIDRKAMVSVVDRAAGANIPMVIFDSGVDTDRFVSRVATDNYKAGEMAAQRLGKILNAKGKAIIVAVQPGAASTEAREKGFEETIQKQFPGIQIIDKRFGLAEIAKSLTVTENMLTAHPDVDGIFASNESSTMGAAQALRGRQGKIKLVGFDWSPTLLDDLSSGLIDSLVVQNPFEMGYQAVSTAVRKLDGKTVQKLNDMAPRLIDKSNLNDPEIYAQLHPDLKKYLN